MPGRNLAVLNQPPLPLIALVPGLDTKGRNILPVGSADFVTGWSDKNNITTASVSGPDGDGWYTITFSGVSAGGYYRVAVSGATGLAYSAVEAYAVSGSVFMSTTGGSPQNLTSSPQLLSTSRTGNGAYIGFYLSVDSVIKARNPQINFGSLLPYSAPSGIPESLTSRYGSLTAQNGSTATSDTNDGSYNGTGWVGGADDYLVANYPELKTDAWTYICVFAPTTLAASIPLVSWSTGAHPTVYANPDATATYGSVFMGANNYKYFTTPSWQIGSYKFMAATCPGSSQGDIEGAKYFVGETECAKVVSVSTGPQTAKTTRISQKASSTYGQSIVAYEAQYRRVLTPAQIRSEYRKIKARLFNDLGLVVV